MLSLLPHVYIFDILISLASMAMPRFSPGDFIEIPGDITVEEQPHLPYIGLVRSVHEKKVSLIW